MNRDVLEYGNSMQIIGVVVGNPNKTETIFLPQGDQTTEHIYPAADHSVLFSNEEEITKIFKQMDTQEIEGKEKIILRKSERQIQEQIRWNIFKRDSYSCVYCHRDDIALTVDHVILWELGGDSVEGNLLSACKKCNKTRASMDFIEWLHSKYFLKLQEGRILENITGSLYAFYNNAKEIPLRANLKRNRY